MPKYRVKADPYYIIDIGEQYDSIHREGDIIELDRLPAADGDGDISLPVRGGISDYISLDCLEEVKDPGFVEGDLVRDEVGQYFVYDGGAYLVRRLDGTLASRRKSDLTKIVPDGIQPVVGDEVIGRLLYSDFQNEWVRGRVVDAAGGEVVINPTDGPAGVTAFPKNERTVVDIFIVKAADPLADCGPELTTEGKILLELTEEEAEWLADEKRNFVSPTGVSVSAKAKALLPKPKPKTVTVEADKTDASYAYSALLGATDARIVRFREALRQSIDIKGL
jgi:hypothetical protein